MNGAVRGSLGWPLTRQNALSAVTVAEFTAVAMPMLVPALIQSGRRNIVPPKPTFAVTYPEHGPQTRSAIEVNDAPPAGSTSSAATVSRAVAEIAALLTQTTNSQQSKVRFAPLISVTAVPYVLFPGVVLVPMPTAGRVLAAIEYTVAVHRDAECCAPG